jgi:hypothetical protein
LIPTQIGDREKDLGGIGDGAPFAASADFGCRPEEVVTRRNRQFYERAGFLPPDALSRNDGPKEVSNRARALLQAIPTLRKKRKHRAL